MSRIKGKNTKPEMILRSQLFRQGFRFRVHQKDLPGKPDIVLPKYQTAIFVHGCFWHFHKDCREGRIPSTKRKYWETKLNNTRNRDKKHKKELIELGWNVIVVWECEIEKNISQVITHLTELLVRASGTD